MILSTLNQHIPFFIIVRAFGFKDGEKYKGSWGLMNISNPIFRLCTQINTPRGVFNPGTYVYPFRFRIEKDIVGSSPIRGARTNFQHTRSFYRLKAEVHGPDFPKIKNTQVVDICTVLKKPIVKSQGMQDFTVSTCFCYGGGIVNVVAMLDKNAYQPGETIKATISIDSSNCTVDFETLARLTIYSLNGPQANKVEIGQMCNWFQGVTPGPKVPRGTNQIVNLFITVPQDYTPDINNIKLNSSINTDFQIVLINSYTMNLILNVPITIYAVPALNEPLAIGPAQILQPTEILQEHFKTY